MTVDVLFPFYGDVDLMKQALQSVLDQRYRDFRVVVVDDCYPDDSVEPWFRSLNDPRVEYHRNSANLGANGNYRKALSLAHNELIVVMGADDVMLPTYLNWLVDSASRYPQAAAFQPGVFVMDENGVPSRTMADRVKDVCRPRLRGPRLLTGQRLAVSLMFGNWLYFPSIGWRSSVIREIGFRPEYDVVQDLALVMDIVVRGGSLLADDSAQFIYRRHRGSDSSVRALSGARFAEERRYFQDTAGDLAAHGWNEAAASARLRPSSRLHALSLIPRAVLSGNVGAVKDLGIHVISTSR